MRLIDAGALYTELMRDWDTMDPEEFEKAVFRRLTNAPTIGGWIPCSERLPETEEDFLCIDADENYEVGCYSSNFKHFFFNSCSDIGKPIAWMELPPAYKEDE